MLIKPNLNILYGKIYFGNLILTTLRVFIKNYNISKHRSFFMSIWKFSKKTHKWMARQCTLIKKIQIIFFMIHKHKVIL
jgi:hypothetical protein